MVVYVLLSKPWSLNRLSFVKIRKGWLSFPILFFYVVFFSLLRENVKCDWGKTTICNTIDKKSGFENEWKRGELDLNDKIDERLIQEREKKLKYGLNVEVGL